MSDNVVKNEKYSVIYIHPDTFIKMEFNGIRSRIKELLMLRKRHIVFEFNPGSYLYSRVAAFLAECYRTILDQGGTLSIVSSDPHFIQVLQTMKLDRMVQLAGTLEQLIVWNFQ